MANEFYVSGGSDDNVHVFDNVGGTWTESLSSPITLGHSQGLGIGGILPAAAGLAVSADGTRLLVANYENDSVSLIDIASAAKVAELDLRPGVIDASQTGVPGGGYPFWVAFVGNQKAYVSSPRDREIVIVNVINPSSPSHKAPATALSLQVTGRIKVDGQPTKLILNRSQSLLFAALDNTDTVAVIDTLAACRSTTVVAYPTKGVLQPDTTSDPYFRGFDMNFADYWREQEWAREFDAYVSGGTCNLPNLELLRLPHDHFGRFSTAIDGVNTVETQVADNDYAVGLVADKVAHSICSGNTLIFALEDDAQDGPDHVDAHRSLALVAGPYVKQQAVISTRYTTVSLLRTIEDVLGIQPLGLNDGLAQPMGDVFSSKLKPWTYSVIYPSPLSSTNIPPPPASPSRPSKKAQAYTRPLHDAAYWAKMMEGEDFSVEDHLDTARFNRALWAGLKGEDIPYPTVRDGRDLRHNRKQPLRPDAKQQASQSEIESSGSKGSAGR